MNHKSTSKMLLLFKKKKENCYFTVWFSGHAHSIIVAVNSSKRCNCFPCMENIIIWLAFPCRNSNQITDCMHAFINLIWCPSFIIARVSCWSDAADVMKYRISHLSLWFLDFQNWTIAKFLKIKCTHVRLCTCTALNFIFGYKKRA